MHNANAMMVLMADVLNSTHYLENSRQPQYENAHLKHPPAPASSMSPLSSEDLSVQLDMATIIPPASAACEPVFSGYNQTIVNYHCI